MTVCVLQHLAQGNKGLYISSRSDNLYDNIERRWWALSWGTAKRLWDVRWRRLWIFLRMGELALDLWYNELRESTAFLIDSNVYATVLGDCRVRVELIVVAL